MTNYEIVNVSNDLPITIPPLILSVSESEQTLCCRSRSVDRSCPRRFENLVLRIFHDGPGEHEPSFDLHVLSEPTIDMLEPAGDDGDDRLIDDMKPSCGHK